MTTVFLLRHGLTKLTGPVLAGRTPGVHLDERGVAQAAAAADRLAVLPLATVVTSPLERCAETARAVFAGQRAAGRNPARRTDRRLAECDYGDWTGQEIKSLVKDPLWPVVQSHPSGVTFPGGESMSAMAERAVRAIRDLSGRVAAEHGKHAVWLACSHGDVIKAILADALGIHLDAFQRITVDPASLSVVRYTPLRPFVMSMNTSAGDLSHLKPPARKRSRSRARTSDATVGGGAGPTL